MFAKYTSDNLLLMNNQEKLDNAKHHMKSYLEFNE